MIIGAAVGVVHIVAEHAPMYAGAQPSSPVKIPLHIEERILLSRSPNTNQESSVRVTRYLPPIFFRTSLKLLFCVGGIPLNESSAEI